MSPNTATASAPDSEQVMVEPSQTARPDADKTEPAQQSTTVAEVNGTTTETASSQLPGDTEMTNAP